MTTNRHLYKFKMCYLKPLGQTYHSRPRGVITKNCHVREGSRRTPLILRERSV